VRLWIISENPQAGVSHGLTKFRAIILKEIIFTRLFKTFLMLAFFSRDE